jgi:hypothetical protein
VVPTLACSGLNFSEVAACRRIDADGGAQSQLKEWAAPSIRAAGTPLLEREDLGTASVGGGRALGMRGIVSAGGAKVGEDGDAGVIRITPRIPKDVSNGRRFIKGASGSSQAT